MFFRKRERKLRQAADRRERMLNARLAHRRGLLRMTEALTRDVQKHLEQGNQHSALALLKNYPDGYKHIYTGSTGVDYDHSGKLSTTF